VAGEIRQDRRRFLGAAATTIAAAQLGMVGPADAQPGKTDARDKAAVRPFRINVAEEQFIDLRQRHLPGAAGLG
jgi:hypothetical protein